MSAWRFLEQRQQTNTSYYKITKVLSLLVCDKHIDTESHISPHTLQTEVLLDISIEHTHTPKDYLLSHHFLYNYVELHQEFIS